MFSFMQEPAKKPLQLPKMQWPSWSNQVRITYSKWGYSKDNGEKAEDVKEQHGNIVVSSS